MRISLALIASLGLVGCVGGLESAGPTADPEEGGTGGGTVNEDAATQAKRLYEETSTRSRPACASAATTRLGP